MRDIEYEKFHKTKDSTNLSNSFSGVPIFTPALSSVFIGQHHKIPVVSYDSRYVSVGKTAEWLREIKFTDADKWLAYIKEMHLSVKENGAYLDCPAKVAVYDEKRLIVKDGDHRVGACVANKTRASCIIVNQPTVDFRKYVDYKTKMPVSVQYDEWRGDENRHKAMETIDWKGKNVLDLGCNTGSACNAANALGAKRVYGIDYDPDCIFEAAKPKMCFICHDLSKGFAIKDDIDILIMNSIVHWVGSPAFYEGVRKIVEKGADVLFEAHHETMDLPLYNAIKKICPNRTLIGYSPFKKGASRKRGIYLMSNSENMGD